VTGRRRGAPRGRRPGRVLVAALASLVAGATLAASGGPGLAAAVPGPRPVQAQPAGPGLRLVERTAWVAPDGEFALAVRVDDPPADARVRIVVHGALRGRFEFAATLDGSRLGPVRGRPIDAPLADLDPTGDGVLRARIGTGPPGTGPDAPPAVPITGAGVYPVEVVVTDAAGEPWSSLVTHLVRLPTRIDHPIGLVSVVDLTAPPVRAADGSAAVDADARARLTLARRALDEVPGAILTAPITGDTLEALADGPELDVAVVDGLGALARAGRLAIVASGWVRPAPATLDRSGLADMADMQLDRGRDAVTTVLGVAPDPAAAIVVDRPEPQEVDGLARRGVTRVVLPDDALPPLDPNRFVTSLTQPFIAVTPDGAELRALATDPDLQLHLTPGADPILATHHGLAELGAIYLDRPAYRRALAVILPDPVTAPAVLPVWLSGVATSPLLRSDSLAGAIAGADPAGSAGTDAIVAAPDEVLVRSIVPASAPDQLSGYRADVELTQLGLTGLRSMFPDDDALHRDLSDQLDTSSAADLTGAGRAAHLRHIGDEVRRRSATVDMEGGRTITLAARDGTLPLVLRNDADEPARVTLHLDADKLEFPDGDRVLLELVPGTTSIEVAVRARASGAFPLDLEVRSPDGLLEVTAVRYIVRSTAVSGLGVVLGVAAGLVLVVWWVRTARRARRAGRQMPAPAGAPASPH